MKKKIEVGTVIFIVVVAVVLACLATYMYLTSLMPSLVAKESFYDRITEVYKTIKQRYVSEFDSDSAMDSLLTGYVSGIDKYSTYLDADEYAQYTAQLDGRYSGIGVTVKYISTSGLLKVVNVKSNSPADNEGIKIGDLIFKINNTDVSTITYEEATTMLRAENGTEINLNVIRGDKELSKSITVAEYITSSIDFELLYDDVGYISISEFDNTTTNDFINAYEELEKNGAKQFIFDVRNNTGGGLTSVVDILDYILPEGTLVTLSDNSGKDKSYSSDKKCIDKEFVVLINNSTYSGGELFAAAVRDFKAGKLIGENTYGKGYAQEVIPLTEGALYLSTKLYYPPNGENYEGVGVAPDIEVNLSSELEDRFYELTPIEDTQISAALKELGKDISSIDDKASDTDN